MNDMERLDNMRKNIEIERERLGFSQQHMANAIGMSLSSYRRMVAGEMNLRASIVLKNLYDLTGKLPFEFMEERTPHLSVAYKIRSLSKEQLKVVDELIDLLIKNN